MIQKEDFDTETLLTVSKESSNSFAKIIYNLDKNKYRAQQKILSHKYLNKMQSTKCKISCCITLHAALFVYNSFTKLEIYYD